MWPSLYDQNPDASYVVVKGKIPERLFRDALLCQKLVKDCLEPAVLCFVTSMRHEVIARIRLSAKEPYFQPLTRKSKSDIMMLDLWPNLDEDVYFCRPIYVSVLNHTIWRWGWRGVLRALLFLLDTGLFRLWSLVCLWTTLVKSIFARMSFSLWGVLLHSKVRSPCVRSGKLFASRR